jgi:hypothetical protein
MILLVTLDTGEKIICPYNTDDRRIIDVIFKQLNQQEFIELSHTSENKSNIIACDKIRHIEVNTYGGVT